MSSSYLLNKFKISSLITSVNSVALFSFVLCVLQASPVFSQEETNQKKLLEIAQERTQIWQTEKAAAEAFAKANGIPIKQITPDGSIIEIQKIVNGIPIFYITDNIDAARTAETDRLWPGGGLGLSLTGSGYSRIGEWDGGAVLTGHQEFGGRVTQADGTSTTSDHATHVAGTIVAAGFSPNAKGMAYQANLKAYYWDNDEAEMAAAAADGMEVSNHSYSIISGWYGSGHWYGDISVDQNESYYFGFYNSGAQLWDEIAYNAPYYLIVKSAGNDRNDEAPAPGTPHSHNGSGTFTDTHYDDGHDGGYDTVPFRGVGKNVLTVGAVDDISSYINAASVVMSSFSGWGPADDGRIKPDIVANGISLYSASGASTSSYSYKSGTSMSAPSTTGTLALLQQHFQHINSGISMRSATLKALVLHTAHEAGAASGPDYQFGWGLLDAETAAEVISNDATHDGIAEYSLSDGESFSRDVVATGSEPLRVTIVWTDPAGTPVSAQLDPATPMLVNDLDLRIVKGGTTYYPWKLDRLNPSASATRSAENNLENVEKVEIDSPVAESYTIEVDHDGSLTGGSQRFSLIITGNAAISNPPQCSPNLISPNDGDTDVQTAGIIEWETAIDASSYDFYLGTDNPPTNLVNGANQVSTEYSSSLNFNTTYNIKIVPRNAVGVASGCATWSFTTGSRIIDENFDDLKHSFEDATDDDIDWTIYSGSTPSSGTGPSGDHTSGSGYYMYIEASSPNYPDKTASLLTPTLELSTSVNPTLEFWYHIYDAYNAYMGDLYIDVYSQGSWNNAVFSVSGNQGDSWHLANIDLSPYSAGTEHKIRFRGITGSDWRSDIAIDDIVIRSEAFKTIVSGSSASHTFPNTGTTIQFTTPNSGDITVEVIKQNSNPGTIGMLPAEVTNVSAERYWQVPLRSGNADGVYSITFDLAGMTGISDYSTLKLLKRTDNTSSWAVAGTNAYPGSGTSVTWTGISDGFSEFGIGGAGDNSLPVSLQNFMAETDNEKIVLRWITESELENDHFILERSEDGEAFNLIAKIPGIGNSSSRHTYEYADEHVIIGNTYYYRLADRDYNGRITYHKTIVAIAGEQIPKEFSLSPVYPNPFNPETQFRFELPMNQRRIHEVNISVFNALGQRVRQIFNGKLSVGRYEKKWNGKDDNGTPLPSGSYFLKMDAGIYVEAQKMILIR